MRKSLQSTFCTEIRASDANYYHKVNSFALPVVTNCLAVRDKRLRSLGREMFPTEKIVACTALILKNFKCFKSFGGVFLNFCIFNKGAAASHIYF